MGVADARGRAASVLGATVVESFRAGERAACGSGRAGRACGHGGRASRSAPGGEPWSTQRLPTRTASNGSATRRGVIEVRGQSGTGPTRRDRWPPPRSPPTGRGRRWVVHRRRSPALVPFDHVDHNVALQIDQPGHVDRGVGRRLAAEERRLVDTELPRLGPMRSGSSTSGVPCSMTAFMIVHQHPQLARELGSPGGRSHRPADMLRAPARRVRARPGRRRARRFRSTSTRQQSGLHGSATSACDQHSRVGRPKQGQITHVDRHPILRLGAHTTNSGRTLA